jgi:pilus assembly protein CpaD
MTNNRHRRLAATNILVAAGLVLSSCGAGSMPSPEMASAHVPVVSQTMLVYDLRFGDGQSLSGTDRQSFLEWLESINVGYGDRISVDDPNPGARQRRAAVADAVAEFGLLLADNVPVTASAVAPGEARVVVLRATASVPGCPDWRRASHPELAASKMSNFGCATESNLAAMVADSNDLVAGKAYAGTDAISTSAAVKTYRKRAGKQTQRAKSTVGQATQN